MQRYTKSVVLGQGTYGKVVKAVDNETGCITAIKKIRVAKEKEGVHVTALREIKVLKELKHEHVLELLDIFHHKRNLNLVFEYMHSDLEAVIKDERMPLKPGDVKAYMLMTVKAVAYCHGMWVLHRDLKPNNLLIAPDGSLKLADFGLARVFGSPDRRLTNQVFQRWYRAPELLFGARQYGSAVDMWALGCIFAELLLRRPYFAGNTDLDQLSKVFSALGTPTEADWPGHRTLPDFVEFAFTAAPDKRRTFPNATDDALSLLSRLLTFDPNKRITAEEALQHRYFKTSPAPTASDKLPRPKPFAPEEDEPIPPPLEEPRLRASPETRCSLAERVSFPLGTSEGSKGGGQALRVSLSRPFQVSLPDEPTSGGPASARSMPMSVVRGHVRNSSCGSDALMMSGGSDRPLPTSIESGEGGRSPLPFGGSDRRYIRKRKMELDEALLSASQDDPNLSPPEEEGR